jgi:hypothetical protein
MIGTENTQEGTTIKTQKDSRGPRVDGREWKAVNPHSTFRFPHSNREASNP